MKKVKYIISAAVMIFTLSMSAAAADFIFKYSDGAVVPMAAEAESGYLAPGIYTADNEEMLKAMLEQGIIEYYEPNEKFYLLDDWEIIEDPDTGDGPDTELEPVEPKPTEPEPTEPEPVEPEPVEPEPVEPEPEPDTDDYGEPNDPLYITSQRDYELGIINAVGVVNNRLYRGQGVRVGIVDSGIAPNHEDLNYENIVSRYYVTAAREPQVVESAAEDMTGHGTAVAGIIAAATNNGVGTASLAPDAELVIVRVFDDNSTSTDRIIAGLQCAMEQGCDVINLSVGIYSRLTPYNYDPPKALKEMVDRINDAGIILVAAAGNYGESTAPEPETPDAPDALMFPASYDEVISVGSVDSEGVRSHFSYSNKTLDVAAAGERVQILNYQGGYRTNSGTSFSAPYVASVAALAKQLRPEITMAEFSELLADTARDVGDEGWDKFYGYGIVDVAAMIDSLVEEENEGGLLVVGDIQRDGTSFKVAITNKGLSASRFYSFWTTDWGDGLMQANTVVVEPGETVETAFSIPSPANVSHMLWNRDTLEPVLRRRDISVDEIVQQ